LFVLSLFTVVLRLIFLMFGCFRINMKSQSKKLHSDVLLCLNTKLSSNTDVSVSVRDGGSREVNRVDTHVIIVEVAEDAGRNSDITSVGGDVEQTLVENGFSREDFVVSNVSGRPELIDVLVGVDIHSQF